MTDLGRGGFHWSRHSRILLGAGAIYIGIGVSYFYTPKIYVKAPSLKIPLQLLTLDQWGWVYIVSGIIAMVTAVIRFPGPYGYMVLAALSSAWSAFYIAGVIFENAPKLTLVTGLIFGILAFVWVEVSGFIAPETVKQTVKEHGYGPD